MSKIIDTCYVIEYSDPDGYTSVEPTIYLSRPHVDSELERVLVFPSPFVAHAFIEKNIFGVGVDKISVAS